MKIVADENIPYVREAFGALGEVTTVAGRSITAQTLAEAEVLLVRSITKVNRALLEGTPVRFVATATIGEDHVDKAYLAERGIAFSSAPGCNANSVGEYIVAALLVLAEKHRLDLQRLSLGIVGVGNVGKKVHAKAQALGLRCVLNDPPLAAQSGDPKYRPMDEILACDIITLHVPLEKSGDFPTWHLADERFLSAMKPGAILINSSRGPVVDNAALKHALKSHHLRAAVLDVWEGEPNLDPELLRMADLGTPHIAGYSFDGKVNGTRQIYEACCAFLGIAPTWDPSPLLPAPDCPEWLVDPVSGKAVAGAVRAVYDIIVDDAAMRGVLDIPESERGTYFDKLRKNYPRRREFFNTRVRFSMANSELEDRMAGLGFRCE